jgi:hypothetical protein
MHVTARRIARPPKVTFVTSLQSRQLPSERLVCFRASRQLSGWKPPPLVVIRAQRAHCQNPTCGSKAIDHNPKLAADLGSHASQNSRPNGNRPCGARYTVPKSLLRSSLAELESAYDPLVALERGAVAEPTGQVRTPVAHIYRPVIEESEG